MFGCPKKYPGWKLVPVPGNGIEQLPDCGERAGKLLRSSGDPKIWFLMVGASPAWRKFPSPGEFPGENPLSLHWRSQCSSPSAHNNPSLEQIPFPRIFLEKIPSQFPHPPLEIPMFHSGLFITTLGWNKFPFPGFSRGKFLVDLSGIC